MRGGGVQTTTKKNSLQETIITIQFIQSKTHIIKKDGCFLI